MTDEQVILVKNSWKIFRNVNPATIANLFYSKLFFDHPRVRKMFPDIMEQQYVKFIDMLTMIVSRLDNPEEITEELKALAERHAGYGVHTEHYPMVGEALLWTLEKGLGSDWNKDVEKAWAACYKMIAGVMINATTYSEG